jgi:hypothetical protein
VAGRGTGNDDRRYLTYFIGFMMLHYLKAVVVMAWPVMEHIKDNPSEPWPMVHNYYCFNRGWLWRS